MLAVRRFSEGASSRDQRDSLLRRSAVATTHPRAVTENVRHLLRVAGASSLIAVVKADGFGHGMIPVAQASLEGGAAALGVTSLDEAQILRNHGITSPVLSWLNSPDADFEWACESDIDIAIPSRVHLDAVARAAGSTQRRARVHLDVDVGMARDGAPRDEVADLTERAAQLHQRGVIDVVGLMGHLPNADQGPDASDPGIARFHEIARLVRAAGLRPRLHLAATAAALTDPRTHVDAIRPGAGLVGIDPSGTVELEWAMTLSAPVVHTQHVAAGTAVGYGSTWHAPRETTLALLPVGYADGIPREIEGAYVWLAGRRRPVVGRVSMDAIVIDTMGDLVPLGEVATIFGPQRDDPVPTAAEWATWANTIAHCIVTGIGPRVIRHYEEN